MELTKDLILEAMPAYPSVNFEKGDDLSKGYFMAIDNLIATLNRLKAK